VREYEWLTYSGAFIEPEWIERLKVTQGQKNLLIREARRVSELAYGGHYWDKDRTPVPDSEAVKYRHDLALWDDPRAVLWLVRSDGVDSIRGMGPKNKAAIVEALTALVQ
jgi:hypothetical protein